MCDANRRRQHAATARQLQRRRNAAYFGLEPKALPKVEHILDDNTDDPSDPLQDPVLHRAEQEQSPE